MINPPTITVVRDFQPAFLEGKPDSISAHLRKSRTISNNPVTNMNTSVFGHLVQNSSSQALKELFGIKQPKTETVTFGGTSKFRGTNFKQESVCDALSGDKESIHTRSSRTRDSKQATQTQGGGDPGDSDGDDSDDIGGNKGPWKGPRKLLSPCSGRKNPFNAISEEVSPPMNKAPPEPQFDTKLKLDIIPTWDGNPENLRHWLLKINSLSKQSPLIFKQLGTLVPTRLTGSAETWYYSQSVETHDRIEVDWNTLHAAIGKYYMNCAFLNKQKAHANHASYHDGSNGRETPSEYVICKLELLQFMYNYTDRELINEIMEGAPSYWTPIITPHLFQDLEQFQLSVQFHEDSLLKLGGGENSYNRQGNQNHAKDSPHRSPHNPFRNAHINLVGWSQTTSNPQFPKDDSNVSPCGTPEEKGARPCRHCGSVKHWDKDCKYARKGEKRVRVNIVSATQEDDQAQEEYDNAYYDRFSNKEDMEDSQDFQKPSHL